MVYNYIVLPSYARHCLINFEKENCQQSVDYSFCESSDLGLNELFYKNVGTREADETTAKS